jgi:hypothetical protein
MPPPPGGPKAQCNHHLIDGSSAIQDGKCALCGSSATLQPFEKMLPGEVDKIFQASCPRCDGRVWEFIGLGTIAGTIDPDARACKNCHYIHWLRGEHTSEVIPLRRIEPVETPKKDRVRALVFALLASTRPLNDEVVAVAKILDDEIEAIK